jgi:purine-binding chemotaxis protein CheW
VSTAGNSIRSRRKEAAVDMAEVCSIHLGDGLYGLPISHILEIVGDTKPETVPLAPAFVGGLVHYRGEVLTTVCARQLLGMPPLEGKLPDLLVVESASGCFGLIVDSVREVLTVSQEDFEPTPSTIHERSKAFFAGTYKLKDKLMVMLDPARINPVELAKTN